MANTITASLNDGIKGGQVAFGTMTHNPASLSTNTERDDAITVTGVRQGDAIFLSPRNLDDGLIVMHAYVSADDEVTIRLYNVSGGTVDGAEVTYDFILFRPVSVNEVLD